MTLFYILIILILIGASAIAWILISEKMKESPAPEPKKTTQPQLSPKQLLDRLGLENPKPVENKQAPETIKQPAQAESEISLKYDELLIENNELKSKYAKVEALFAEKSLALEKSEKTLNNELKNQKEFNKVKDILEKEIKDSKDRINSLQADVMTAQTETQTQLKRVSQLEEKVKKLEMDVLTSEAAINDAQALTQQARKHSADLEEKLRLNENQILEKNQKIEDLVIRLKDLPNNSSKNNALKDPTPIPQTPSPIVDEQGGAKIEIKEEKREDAPIEEKSKPLNIQAPETVPLLDQQPSKNVIIEKNPDGALTLSPDIFANPPAQNPTPPNPELKEKQEN